MEKIILKQIKKFIVGIQPNVEDSKCDFARGYKACLDAITGIIGYGEDMARCQQKILEEIKQ